MENQNHHFDDIDFEIYFAQEQEGHISKIDSKQKVSVSLNELLMNVGYKDIITKMVLDQRNNHSIHVVDTDLGYSTFFNGIPHEYLEAPSLFELKEESNIGLVVEDGSLCVFQNLIPPEDLHEHTKPSLLVEDEKDEQLKSALHSNPSFYEYYNQQDESSRLPLCFASFDFLK